MKKILRKEFTIGSRHGANFLLLRSLLHDEPDSPKANYCVIKRMKKRSMIRIYSSGMDMIYFGWKNNQAKNVFSALLSAIGLVRSSDIFLLVELEQMDTAKSAVTSLNDAHPKKKVLAKYVKQNGEMVQDSPLSDFWIVSAPALKSPDLFWSRLQERKIFG